MATRIIDDSKLNDIAVAIQAKDSGGQMTVDEIPTRIDALQVADPDEQLIKLFTNTIEYIKIDEPINTFPRGVDSGGIQYIYSNLKFASAKNTNNNTYLEAQTFFNCPKLKYVNIGKLKLLLNLSLGYSTQMKTLVILSPTQIDMQNSNVIAHTAIASGTGYVWVFDSLKSDYQNATNWSVYASQIKGFSEAPIYSDSVTHEIGDVCQYNGRFYGYCKRDLTSSTGNPPTGTTADNDYWEYVADIEVI